MYKPITLKQANDLISAGLALLPASMNTLEARVMLLTIGLQESRLSYTKQIKGPAKGYWQFEAGGGVKGVMNHPASKKYAKKACELIGIPFEQKAIYDALEFNDVLAVVFARLLLFTDPMGLPTRSPNNTEVAWKYYFRNWRPGKPHRETWDKFYTDSLKFIEETYHVKS